MPESVEVLRMEADVFEEEGLVDPDELSGLSLSSEAGKALQLAPPETCEVWRLQKYSCCRALSAEILLLPSNLSIAWWQRKNKHNNKQNKTTNKTKQHNNGNIH